jgi:hypothetical protein
LFTYSIKKASGMKTFYGLFVAAAAAVVFVFPALAQSPAVQQALVIDSAESSGKFYMLVAIEGTPVRNTSLGNSVSASTGQGSSLRVLTTERLVPAGKVKLTLRGTQGHAAPISAIFSAVFRGGDPDVSGEVTVDLEAGKRYTVRGQLDSLKNEVWLEDAAGVEVPGSKLATKVDPEMAKQMEGAVFTATNLRYSGDWISDSLLANYPVVPVGSRIKIGEYGSNRVSVLINGRKMRMGVDFGRGKETIQQFVARATAAEDPRNTVAAYPDKIRNAIGAGQVVLGMTKAQVLIAMGRPSANRFTSMSANEWVYSTEELEEIFMVFDDAGLLKEVDASRRSRKLVVYEGQ